MLLILRASEVSMNKQKTLLRLAFFVISLSICTILLVAPVDTTDYRDSKFYTSTLARKDSLAMQLEQQQEQKYGQNSTLQAGWGRASITPAEPVRLTGKNFAPFEHIFDSVFVRTFMFDNDYQRVVLVSYDLWFIHPNLAHYLRQRIQSEFPEIDGIYFTANHSHTSIGGWASGLLGTLVVGGNHQETVKFIGESTIASIYEAKESLRPSKYGFGSVATEGLVANRLVQNGPVDGKLRILQLENDQYQLASFTTYSAHSVYMNKDINTLSADYSGPFLNYVEQMEGMDFASFAPGATGSHTPVGRKPFVHQKMLDYSRKLAKYFGQAQKGITSDSTEVLRYVEWPVDLRSPHFRIANHWRLRPWIFNAVMGKSRASITALRVGDVVLVGLPVELSGEYYPEFESICKQKGLSLMITTFNGWYLGYVNPEKYYYTIRNSETREMNWYGPQNGEYFVELIKELLTII